MATEAPVRLNRAAIVAFSPAMPTNAVLKAPHVKQLVEKLSVFLSRTSAPPGSVQKTKTVVLVKPVPVAPASQRLFSQPPLFVVSATATLIAMEAPVGLIPKESIAPNLVYKACSVHPDTPAKAVSVCRPMASASAKAIPIVTPATPVRGGNAFVRAVGSMAMFATNSVLARKVIAASSPRRVVHVVTKPVRVRIPMVSLVPPAKVDLATQDPNAWVCLAQATSVSADAQAAASAPTEGPATTWVESPFVVAPLTASAKMEQLATAIESAALVNAQRKQREAQLVLLASYVPTPTWVIFACLAQRNKLVMSVTKLVSVCLACFVRTPIEATRCVSEGAPVMQTVPKKVANVS